MNKQYREKLFGKEKTIRIPYHLEPSGCIEDYISQPGGKPESIRVASFDEHRFAFYYWIKWTGELKVQRSALVTFDWHQDLCPPYQDKVEGLKNLDLTDLGQVAFYTWAELERTNDVQIYSALMLNLLSDVFVICRQKTSRKSVETVRDYFGNDHQIFIYHSIEDFESDLDSHKMDTLFFDIDLDFFTLSNPITSQNPYNTKRFTYLSKKEISSIFSSDRPAMQWIYKRMAGFTIAREPGFCGGLNKSNYLFRLIENTLFTGHLFNSDLDGKGDPEWRHLIYC